MIIAFRFCDQMAEGGGHSRYVKLTKEQTPVEDDIKPGELNQPIEVPQVSLAIYIGSKII